MKKINLIISFILLVISVDAQKINWSGSQAIPDNNSTGTTVNIPVNGIGVINTSTIGLVRVMIDIEHTYDEDLDIYLTDPSGTFTIDLSSDNGYNGDDDYDSTEFYLHSSYSITAADPPFEFSYLPEQSLNTFNVPGSVNADGNWQLKIVDDANGDFGTIYNAYVEFNDPSIIPKDADLCAVARPFCTSQLHLFENNINTTAQVGPDYGCLQTQPNPAWYYLKISQSGNIIIHIEQKSITQLPIDVDFICWGPFADEISPCITDLMGATPGDIDADHSPSGNIIDCSFNSAAVEDCTIPNALLGEHYLVLITNYADDPGFINFSKIGGTGETDCAIIEPPLAIDIINFKGESIGVKNRLNWNSYGSYNEKFIVERSENGDVWNEIGVVEHANSNSYYFDDYKIESSNYYYRLKQIDNQISFSEVIQIENNFNKQFEVYPNPANDVLNFVSIEGGEISVINSLGQVIDKVHISADNVSIKTGEYKEGIYIIKLNYNNIIKYQKLIIKH